MTEPTHLTAEELAAKVKQQQKDLIDTIARERDECGSTRSTFTARRWLREMGGTHTRQGTA